MSLLQRAYVQPSTERSPATDGSSGTAYLGPLKTRASYRTVEAPDVVLEALAWHIKHIGTGPDGLLFVTPLKSVPIRDQTFDSTWHAMRRQTDVRQDVTSHDLRHHYASVLISAGCSVPVVQRAMGHATPMETLNTYTHWWPQDKGRTRSIVEAAHRRRTRDDRVDDPADSSRT